jgi:hypothetical protein
LLAQLLAPITQNHKRAYIKVPSVNIRNDETIIRIQDNYSTLATVTFPHDNNAFYNLSKTGGREHQGEYECEYGEGVTQDYKLAVKWYRKAAKQGHTGGQRVCMPKSIRKDFAIVCNLT